MNREQRRAYDRKIKKQPNASICPECGHLAMFYTKHFVTSPDDPLSTFYTKLGNSFKDKGTTVLVCERCDAIVREGEELTKMMPPGLYLPTTLEVLDKALLMEAARVEPEEAYINNADGNENQPVEGEGTIA